MGFPGGPPRRTRRLSCSLPALPYRPVGQPSPRGLARSCRPDQSMNSSGDLAALALVLAAELFVLKRGQRRVFSGLVGPRGRVGARFVAYFLVAPGTILHEGAHYLVCLALGVPVGRQLSGADGRPVRTRWFR